MPDIPKKFLATQSMNVGSRPKSAVNAPTFMGPGSIKPPQITVNTIETPVYAQEVSRSQHWFTQKALNRFGDVVLDVTAAMADKEASLLAHEAFSAYKAKQREITHNPDSGYMLKRSKDAVQGHTDFQNAIYDLQMNTMDAVPPRVKVKLNTMILNSQNHALDMGAAHAAKEQRRWVEEGRALKRQHAMDGIKDRLWDSPGDIFAYTLGTVQVMDEEGSFDSEADKNDFRDKMLAASVQLIAQQPGGTSRAKERLFKYKDYMSPKAFYAATQDMLAAMDKEEAKIKKTERDINARKLADRTETIRVIRRSLRLGEPWDDKAVSRMAELKIITEGDYASLKAAAEKGETEYIDWKLYQHLRRQAKDPFIDAGNDIVSANGISHEQRERLINVNEDSLQTGENRKLKELDQFVTRMLTISGPGAARRNRKQQLRIDAAQEQGEALLRSGKPLEEAKTILYEEFGQNVRPKDIGPLWDGRIPSPASLSPAFRELKAFKNSMDPAAYKMYLNRLLRYEILFQHHARYRESRKK